MKRTIIALLLIVTTLGFSQSKGTIKGTVFDKEVNNEPLPFANVFIKGTSVGTTTEFEGTYTIHTTPGTYTLVFSFLGYETIEVPNVIVKASETIIINKTLNASKGVSLNEIQILGSTKKESETVLLTEQRKAIEIKQSIGAEELARKGVSDVATALTKTTGISKQQGSGNIFVRGLGDRYNITTLNGLPLPSNNPSKKNIDLEIFSTDIVEFIGIDKTFNVQNYGDFGGANIDIASKNYSGDGFLNLELGVGVNTEAIAQDQFYLTDGPNMSGFYTIDYPPYPLNNYNFSTSWDRVKAPTPIAVSGSVKGGDSYQVGEESRLSFFAVASYDNEYNYNEGISRGSVNTSGVARKDYDFTSFSYDTNSTFMGNLRFKHKQQTIKYNGLYINTSSESQDEYFGIVDIFDYAPEGGAFVQRATYNRTEIITHQLLGDHKISDNDAFEINWGASYNYVYNDVPDRRQVILTPDDWDDPDGPKSFKNSTSSSDNHRYYHSLEEEELAFNLSASYNFSKDVEDTHRGKVTLGYSGRFKDIAFEATQFNFNINSRTDQPFIPDIYNLDSYFNQESFDANLFTIETYRGKAEFIGALEPQTFGGDQNINAGFLSVNYAFSSRFTMIAGIRGEQIYQFIDYDTSISTGESSLDMFEVLPMLSLKYELNEKQNLKFAASKTYTLPQYKERALFSFEEITQVTQGNPGLYASTNYNVDVKWDIFPKRNEIIALGIFGKLIQNPINDVTINSASNDVSFVNSGEKATAYGAEFEIRKDLFNNEDSNRLSVGFNTSYMFSNQDLDGDKVLRETTEAGYAISVDFSNIEDRISGASDLLVNADLSYLIEFQEEKNLQATIAYNYFSDRIYALGTEGKGNIVDKGINTLDFIVKSNITKKLALGLEFKNMLNPTIERVQEEQDVVVSSFKVGMDAKLKISYTF